MIIPKPMKAPTKPINLNTDLKAGVKYYVQPKLDGIRIKFHNGVPYTNTGKRIPNKRIDTGFRKMYSLGKFTVNADGEALVLDNNGAPLPFNAIQSVIMSHSYDKDLESNAQFVAFDFDDGSLMAPYYSRLAYLINHFAILGDSLYNRFRMIDFCHFEPVDGSELQTIKDACSHLIGQGFEGAMIRRWDSPYMYGKLAESTDIIRKYVEWQRDEAMIVGCIEAQKNLDTSTKQKDAMIPAGYLGAFIVRHKTFGQFQIGSGFNSLQRDTYWKLRNSGLVGRTVTFKYRPEHMKDAPCPAIFIGLRSEEDISV